MIERQRTKRRTWVLRENNDFAFSDSWPGRNRQNGRVMSVQVQRRKAIIEHRDVPIAFRHFGEIIGTQGHCKWVVFGWRQEGAILTVSSVRYPFVSQGVPAHMWLPYQGLRERTWSCKVRRNGTAAVKRQRPSVGLAQFTFVHV